MEDKTMEMLVCFLLVGVVISSILWGHHLTDLLQRWGEERQEKKNHRRKNSASDGGE